MIGEITLNGKSSRDFNVYLTDAGIYVAPERDVETIAIDGRNGELIIDNERYKNAPHSFSCIIPQNFDTNYSAFINYLLNQPGYIRVEDSFKPEEFILARLKNEINPNVKTSGIGGTFKLEFDRKPQRFIKDGEIPVEYTSSGTIYNRYDGKALPLVRVYGAGQLTFDTTTIIINSVDEYVDIDCEIQDAYKGTTNCNGNITLSNNRFFELKPGAINFTIGNGISKIRITPRWWRL